jgi:acyl-CoA thioesterase-2
MSASLDFLVDLLDLEPIEVNIFRGIQPNEERQRVFGGQVAGQALMAAGRTVEHGRVHSLHSYFLRPGDPTVPILYEVDRIRDGRSFTTRRVVAVQHGRAIFNLSASFHDLEDGLEHQIPMPDVPAPETLAPLFERLQPFKEELKDWFDRPHPIDQRHIGDLPWHSREQGEPYQQLWIRADGELPNDPLLHACVATYASDMSLFDTILAPHDTSWDDPEFMGASLDHCMWFHQPFRGRRMAPVRHGLAHRSARPRAGAGIPVRPPGPPLRHPGPGRAGPHAQAPVRPRGPVSQRLAMGV